MDDTPMSPATWLRGRGYSSGCGNNLGGTIGDALSWDYISTLLESEVCSHGVQVRIVNIQFYLSLQLHPNIFQCEAL